MNFTPVQDRVLVRVVEEQQETSGGIFIAHVVDHAQPHKAEVLAVGPGRTTPAGVLVPMTVSPGQTVMFSRGLGQKVKVDSVEYTVLKEDEILGVVEPN